MNLVFWSFIFHLTAWARRKFWASTGAGRELQTGGGIDDQQERSHQGKEEDGGAKDRSCGPTLDQWCDEDSTNALRCLIEALSCSHWKRRSLVGYGSN